MKGGMGGRSPPTQMGGSGGGAGAPPQNISHSSFVSAGTVLNRYFQDPVFIILPIFIHRLQINVLCLKKTETPICMTFMVRDMFKPYL